MKAVPVLERTWYDLKEVAARFGLSYDTVYNAVRNGGIPCIRFGGVYRIPKDWMDNLPQQTIRSFQKNGVV